MTSFRPATSAAQRASRYSETAPTSLSLLSAGVSAHAAMPLGASSWISCPGSFSCTTGE